MLDCKAIRRCLPYVADEELHAAFGGGEGDADGGGGDENRFALAEGGAVTFGGTAAAFFVEDGFCVREDAAAGKAHDHEEGVDVRQVLADRLVQIVEAGREVFARNQFSLRILDGRIFFLIVRIDIEVDGFLRQFRMEFARFPSRPRRP